MADSKASAFPVATSVNNTDYLLSLQNNANFIITVGQLKTAVNSLSSVSIADAAVPLSNNVVGLTGTCTLANASSTTRLLLIAEASGTISFTGGSYSYTTGNVLELIWFANKWNVISVQGMT